MGNTESPARREDVRNVVIVAHVDHGKTTLVDAMLRETGAYVFETGESTVLDSNDLERERGITIFSKNASVTYGDVRVNLVDTPGHADFGSEVERILRMVDGALLLVDAFEGPMPQTRFVLRKSLELGLRPVLVINKMDRANARPDEVATLAFDLFCELNADEYQLDFPLVYTSAKEGWSSLDPAARGTDMKPLFDLILRHVPPPAADPGRPFRMQATMIEYDDFVGTRAIGRIVDGSIRTSAPIARIDAAGRSRTGKVTQILAYRGLARAAVDSAEAGDIVAIAGAGDVQVGETLADPAHPEPLPAIRIDPPTIAMNFSHNTSPLSGTDGGRFLTSRHIRERLDREARTNVGIRVEEVDGGERFKVSGRGELHLAILIETLRREGYEMEVSRPKVILREIDGKSHEPFEEVIVEVEPEYQGGVVQALGSRKAVMRDLQTSAVGTVRMAFEIPSRALIGFRGEFMMLTRGTGILHSIFLEYRPFSGELPERRAGVQISQTAGKAVAYALWGLQERGEIFLRPGDALYEGMIVGAHNKGDDLTVNAVREKKLTNMRSSGADEGIRLIPPREMTIEFAIEFIADDELVEVTPKSIRLRKRLLTENARKTASRRRKASEGA